MKNKLTLYQKFEIINNFGINLDDATIYISSEITADLNVILRMKIDIIKKYWEEEDIPLDEVNIILSSPGGDAISVLAINDLYQELLKEEITVNVHVEGICYSAATLVLGLATGVRSAGANTRFMAHEIQISGEVNNTYTQSKGAQKEVDFIQEKFYEFYCEQSKGLGVGFEEWKKLCEKETYFNAVEAKKLGLINKIT